MKISIVTKSTTGWHQNEILKAAERHNARANFVIIKKPTDIENNLKNCGDVIIWRASFLDHKSERAAVTALAGQKTIINNAVFKQPFVTHKYYQQKVLSSYAGIAKHAIPTYRVRTAKELQGLIGADYLKYPFIMKPNLGAMGKGVELIKSAGDFKKISQINEQIFQNFIPNDFDWRVIVVGGRPLGALKRIAKAGSHLNNISQGATAKKETNEAVLNTLFDIACRAASLFDLTYGGVDIIQDKNTGEYFILEVNTAPQWDGEQGFNKVIGVDVADELIKTAIVLGSRNQKNLSRKIETYFKDYLGVHETELFHFASRLWLWKEDEWARKQLDGLKANYIGSTPKEIQSKIASIAKRKESFGTLKIPARVSYAKKYPKLKVYNELLFKVIFCDSLYGIDIRPYIRERVSDEELIEQFQQLVRDKQALCVLATHAVNFFYLLKNYFNEDYAKNCDVLIDPQEFLDLLPEYDKLVQKEIITQAESVKLQIYLLTHAIIGDSGFYQKPVTNPLYQKLCKRLEKIIHKNYFDVSLDNKCEFLVCAKLCGYKTNLRGVILDEAKKSLSWAGNFIVDKHNSRGESPLIHTLRKSEHRNVLLIMATHQFSKAPSASNQKDHKNLPVRTIGRLSRVDLGAYGMARVVARVDTGASVSAICATDVYEKDGVLHFKLLNSDRAGYTGKEVTTNDYITYLITNTANVRQPRYATKLKVKINDNNEKILFTLADRRNMLYPVLLGRNFLRDRYRVDVSKQFLKPRKMTK